LELIEITTKKTHVRKRWHDLRKKMESRKSQKIVGKSDRCSIN